MLFSFQMSAQCTIQVVTTGLTEETCVGSSDASATATAAGAGPISYLWSDGQTTATAINLTTGNYTVTATDDLGCTGIATAEITLDPEGVWLMFTSTPVTCNGGSDGTAHVSVMTGVAPYTYIWNDPAGTTNADPVNLAAGQYTVTVTDTNGCSNYGPVTITEPTEIIVISSTTNETCFGDADGTASVSVSGGTPGYTYLWSDGQTNATANNLIAGDYTVTVMDANDCPSTTTLTVELTNPQIVITGTSTSVSCFGGNDGSATVTVNTGNGPFSYSWSNGGNSATNLNLIAGDYTVTVTGANGCTSVTTVSVSEPPALIVTTTTTTNVLCNGGSDGSITVSSTGGTGSTTYSWSNGETTETISNLSAGTYTVTATDNNGCTATTSATITEPNQLAASGSGTDVTISGGNDGTATVTPSGGTPGYTYSWSDGQTTATAINLSAGTYTVTVTDSNGCTTTTIVIINEPLTLTITSTSSACGLNEGTATVTASGGTPGYTYLWSDGQTSATATGLAGGSYTVTVTDSNGLTSTTSVTVASSNSSIIATTSHSNETCVGSSDGHVAVSTSGGVGQMTFEWSNGATTDIVNNLSAGTYTVTVTDQNGCTASSTEIIELSPEGIWVDITTTNACFGGGSGTATAIVTTGVAPYTYAWSNGGNTPTITNLSAGDYTVTVTDTNGCIGIFTTTISEESQIIATTSHSNETCVGSSDGHVAVSTSGGLGQMTYAWSNGATTDVVNNLSAGTYTVTVTDENGCTASSTEIIELSPEGIWVDITTTHVSCFNGNDGSATAIVTTGVAPYTYAWSNGGNTPTITNLSAGDYTVTVTDSNGCIGVFTTTVTQPTQLIATTTSTNTTCGLATGTATVTATGGTLGYTYLWSNGQTTQNINGLLAGTYTATVTDANGCTSVSSTTITNMDLVIVTTVSTTDPSGPGASDGSIDIDVTGGSNYTYMWSNSATTQDITGLMAGCYTVTVTDGAGVCAAIDTICIGCMLDLTVTTTNNDCLNNSIGTATATITSSCSSTTYTYSWTTGTGAFVGTTQTLTGLLNGTYVVTVTDGDGLTVTGTGVVTGSGGITSSVTQTNNLCNGDSTGTATVTGMGGTTYTYLWSNNETTQTITMLTAGTYTVTVTDTNTNCTSVSQVTIVDPPVTTITATTSSPTIPGGNDGSITITVTGGTPGYTYLWSTGATTPTIMDLPVGCYTVTVTDANGCTTTAEPCITPPPTCLLTVTSTPESCNPGSDGTAMASVIGCTPPISYVWENSQGTNMGSTAMIMNLTAGMYYVTATDANLIIRNDSVEVIFDGGLDANADAEKVTCNSFTDGAVSSTPIGGTSPYSYNWEDASGVIGSTANISNLSIGTYTVTVTDAVGCTAVDEVEIDEDDPITLIPTIDTLDCNGATNASITVVASGGIPNYTYEWSTSSIDVNNNITGISSGVYTVTVTDQNLCTKVDSFMISDPSAITITADPDTSICKNFLTINATASAGATISWFNQNNLPLGTGSSLVYLNIPSGTNKVYAVAEANGCQEVDSIIVIQNAVDVSVDAITSICQGDITQLTATNNIDPDQIITYDWTPASIFTAGANTATPTLNTSVTGVYEVYLSSENQFGCIQLDTISVAVQDTTTNFIVKQQCIELEVNYTSASGTEMIWNFGDGSAEVTAISTTHTYMSADDYTVMMILPPGTNNAACLPDTVTQVVTVVDGPIFNPGFTLTYDPCVEDSTTVYFADISTIVIGSIDSVTWTWQGDTISTSSQDSLVITQSVMDSLTLYITSEDGCVDSISQEIDIIVISNPLQDTIVACVGAETPLNPFGNPDYQYTWSPVPNGDPNEINPIIFPSTSATYSVTITDSSGTNPCSIEEEVVVSVPEPLSDLQTSPDTILCGAGTVTLSASSSLANDYNWYNEYPSSPLMIGSPTVDIDLENMDAPQYYYVEAMDQYNCPTVDSILAGNAEILGPLNDVDNCLNSGIIISGGAVSNGEVLMYEWLDPNGLVVGMDSVLTFIPSVEGLYTVNVSNEYGCALEEMFNINIIDVSTNIQATADPDTIILGEIVQLDVDVLDDTNEYTYKWSPSISLIGNNPSEEKSPEAMPDETTMYEVTVTDDVTNCSATTTVLVTVLDICERPYVFFPNVFSPNGDDRNDVLKVESVVVDEVYFVIYNRWGEKVFEGNSVDAAWDGTHNGEPVSSDVYGYYLQARCINGKVFEEKGNVTVLR